MLCILFRLITKHPTKVQEVMTTITFMIPTIYHIYPRTDIGISSHHNEFMKYEAQEHILFLFFSFQA